MSSDFMGLGPRPIEEDNFLESELADAYRLNSVEELLELIEQNDHTAMAVLTEMWIDKKIDADLQTAVSWLEKAAENGDMIAQYKLGTIYHFQEEKSEENATKAIFWTEKAAEQGHHVAKQNLPDFYMELMPNKGISDNPMAAYWFEKDEQFYNLGLHFSEDGNQEKAIEWYERAINSENDIWGVRSWAMRNLSLIYGQEKGHIDKEKAFYWTKMAAEEGLLNSMDELGDMYAKGEVVEQDIEKSTYWYEKAIECDWTESLGTLGRNLYYGHNDFDIDKEKGLIYLKRAAEQGERIAQFSVACLYQHEEEDLERSIFWHELAAKAGYHKSFEFLGDIYADDDEEYTDYAKAVEYYERAAELGNRTAMYELGNMYFYGYDLDRDYKKARFWLEQSIDLDFHQPEKVALYFEYEDALDIVEDDFQTYARESRNCSLSESWYMLGCMYVKGLGVEADLGKGIGYLTLSEEEDPDETNATNLLKELEGKSGMLRSVFKLFKS